ncbi:uncharacterized protein LOC131875118 [Cryptomeria japonica]|uniref:uncharacterized protein LOC131875118 n=1 Tax=Cryptomeria japonica TaxID=3369 RepID=UPI0027DA72AA|nr:uncharacterized protein LOC131875118 [Cryptomeria japonica]
MPLLAKPWHIDFNPLSEKFNKIQVWVRLPYHPLHLWADSLFEEIGDAIGSFIMVDNDSFELYHTTFARILVELEVSKGLLAEIAINSSLGSWVQSLDYEGIPFRCRRCFKTDHVLGNCGLAKKNLVASWWLRASFQHYTVKKSSETFNESLGVGVSALPGSDYLLAMNSSDTTTDVPVIKDVKQVVVSSTENGLLSPTLPVVSQCVGTTFAPFVGCDSVPATIVAPSADTLFSSPERLVLGPSDWIVVETKVEEGWITVKGTHSKTSTPSFDMTIRSHKANCKS